MKKLETKLTVIDEGPMAVTGPRIDVTDFNKWGLLSWVNTIIKPFGIYLVADFNSNSIYPVRTDQRITSAAIQAKMCLGVSKFVKKAANYLPDETNKACENYK